MIDNITTSRKHGFNDDLLKDFSDIQKEFIINEVYPSLKQALLNVSQFFIEIFFLLTTFLFISSCKNQLRLTCSKRRCRSLSKFRWHPISTRMNWPSYSKIKHCMTDLAGLFTLTRGLKLSEYV